MLFICLFLAHCIDDFFLQGAILSNMKQRSWWQAKVTSSFYMRDYIMALFIHAFEWSCMQSVVLYLFGVQEVFIIISCIINGFVHMIIDHLKANVRVLNLIHDQLLHMLQITITGTLAYVLAL